MTADYYSQHIQCTREGKLSCLETVQNLLELAFAAKEYGTLKMDEMMQDRVRFSDKFLRRAVRIVTESNNRDNIEKVLYNLIFTTGEMGNNRFLNCMLIAETMLAISRGEDIDYIFAYLVPSFFGLEYEERVEELYYTYKRERLERQRGDIVDTSPQNFGL